MHFNFHFIFCLPAQDRPRSNLSGYRVTRKVFTSPINVFQCYLLMLHTSILSRKYQVQFAKGSCPILSGGGGKGERWVTWKNESLHMTNACCPPVPGTNLRFRIRPGGGEGRGGMASMLHAKSFRYVTLFCLCPCGRVFVLS